MDNCMLSPCPPLPTIFEHVHQQRWRPTEWTFTHSVLCSPFLMTYRGICLCICVLNLCCIMYYPGTLCNQLCSVSRRPAPYHQYHPGLAGQMYPAHASLQVMAMTTHLVRNLHETLATSLCDAHLVCHRVACVFLVNESMKLLPSLQALRVM